jgi:hypothetical protein
MASIAQAVGDSNSLQGHYCPAVLFVMMFSPTAAAANDKRFHIALASLVQVSQSVRMDMNIVNYNDDVSILQYGGSIHWSLTSRITPLSTFLPL